MSVKFESYIFISLQLPILNSEFICFTYLWFGAINIVSKPIVTLFFRDIIFQSLCVAVGEKKFVIVFFSSRLSKGQLFCCKFVVTKSIKCLLGVRHKIFNVQNKPTQIF